MTEQREPGGIPSEDPNVKKEGTALKEVTLEARGPLLPLGVPDAANVLHRDIELREWKGKQMRELGRLREQHEAANMAEHVSLVLSTMCSRFGPHDFSRLEMKEKRLAISQAFMGDVFFAYCWARLQQLGKQLFFDITCPTCGYVFPWEGDLSTLTLAVADKLEDTFWEYELIDPFVTRNIRVERLVMGPAQWHHVERAQLEGRLDMEGGKLAMIAGIIRGIAGHDEFRLADSEIDELSVRDIETIVGELDSHYIGPDMAIETQCARKICKSRIRKPIDWGYQSFFAASFRSPARGRFTTSSSPSPSTREVA